MPGAEPSVLLFCEPTAGVDIANRIALYELIAEQAETGLGVILSSSDTAIYTPCAAASWSCETG